MFLKINFSLRKRTKCANKILMFDIHIPSFIEAIPRQLQTQMKY